MKRKSQLIVSGLLWTFHENGQADPRILVDDVELTRAVCEFFEVDQNAGLTGKKIRVIIEMETEDDFFKPVPSSVPSSVRLLG